MPVVNMNARRYSAFLLLPEGDRVFASPNNTTAFPITFSGDSLIESFFGADTTEVMPLSFTGVPLFGTFFDSSETTTFPISF